jgi:hypothetical protein
MGGPGGKRADDPSILPDDPLWRRVHPTQVIFDKNQGAHRPSSAAFGDHPNGTPMSIVLGKDSLARGRTGEALLAKFDGYSLAAITATDARENQQVVYRAPVPDEPDHGEVMGDKPKSVQRSFAKLAKWVVLRAPS